jgi:activator of HSP90 ATPase
MNTPTISFDLQEKITSLQTAILDKHPSMPTLLREIHVALRKQPENVVILSEEEIGTIVRGLEVQTNTFLAETVTKSSSKSTSAVARVKKLGADAF